MESFPETESSFASLLIWKALDWTSCCFNNCVLWNGISCLLQLTWILSFAESALLLKSLLMPEEWIVNFMTSAKVSRYCCRVESPIKVILLPFRQLFKLFESFFNVLRQSLKIKFCFKVYHAGRNPIIHDSFFGLSKHFWYIDLLFDNTSWLCSISTSKKSQVKHAMSCFVNFFDFWLPRNNHSFVVGFHLKLVETRTIQSLSLTGFSAEPRQTAV